MWGLTWFSIYRVGRDVYQRLGPTDTANEVNEVALRKLLGAVLMVKPGAQHALLTPRLDQKCPRPPKESKFHGDIRDMIYATKKNRKV